MRGHRQDLGLASAARGWFGYALLIGAQFSVRPLLSSGASIDFALIAVLFSAVRMRPGLAAVTGFLTGLALDALAPESFGSRALLLALLAFGASRLKAAFFTDHVVLIGLFVLAAKWLYDIALIWLISTASSGAMAPPTWPWSPLLATRTALVAVLFLVMFRPLYRPQRP